MNSYNDDFLKRIRFSNTTTEKPFSMTQRKPPSNGSIFTINELKEA